MGACMYQGYFFYVLLFGKEGVVPLLILLIVSSGFLLVATESVHLVRLLGDRSQLILDRFNAGCILGNAQAQSQAGLDAVVVINSDKEIQAILPQARVSKRCKSSSRARQCYLVLHWLRSGRWRDLSLEYIQALGFSQKKTLPFSYLGPV